MWRFSGDRIRELNAQIKFQYIKCDGSAAWYLRLCLGFLYFNTSNVTVQPIPPFVLWHLYFLFQYIKCDGSAAPVNIYAPWSRHFNTSNVTVQQANEQMPYTFVANFNTSNVTVQHGALYKKRRDEYISIHQMWRFSRENPYCLVQRLVISIHQMWRFSPSISDVWILLLDFNTSNVTVQRPTKVLFQLAELYFNTSNVTVQPLEPCDIERFDTISIHQMWRFSMQYFTGTNCITKFQYIKCDGSA